MSDDARQTGAICVPVDGVTLAAGPVRVQGYALAGGDRGVRGWTC